MKQKIPSMGSLSSFYNIYFGKKEDFQKVFWVLKNGQKKCPKMKT
jgi:hypothetical protein